MTVYLSKTVYVKPDKGKKGGSCNRTDCQSPGAVWFNHSTKAWYCRTCAIAINNLNPEAVQQYGHQLCTLNTTTPGTPSR